MFYLCRLKSRAWPFLLAIFFAANIASAQTHKFRVNDPAVAQEMIAQGGRLIADYGNFQLIESSETLTNRREREHVQIEDRQNTIELNAQRLNTRTPAVRALRQARGTFNGKRLHLVQFAGPIKPEWLAALKKSGGRVVTYIPNNAYLIYGDTTSLAELQSWAASADYVQWDGEYADDYKIHPRARLVDEKGEPQTPLTDRFAVQLVQDAEANAATLTLIRRMELATETQSQVLDYLNVIVRLPPDRLAEIAAQPDVISIQPYPEKRRLDERQSQILAGNLTNNFSSPSGPGYLAWLASKGFTQAQFTSSGFAVDVSDSGIDNGTTAPGHFALYQLGNPSAASRVIYNRLEGTANSGSTLQACDGHGNLNAHIIGGYSDLTNFPHTDAGGYRYGLGICPFVKLGSSVIFDPSNFTISSPSGYFKLQNDAYRDGARVSANSWGASVNGDYDVDSQAYDALVRNASTNFAGTNRQMVIVFAAGNDGPGSGSVSSPGSAKNVITVGASENVRSLSTANGGNSPDGYDGSRVSDAGADNANDIINFSSRGPCADGRMKPEIVAPGTHIVAGAPQNGSATTNGTGTGLACFNAEGVSALTTVPATGSISNYFPLGQKFYTESSGTSHSTPAVAGACALVRQYFLNHGMQAASPAMTKAFLVNSARYLTGASANDNLWSPSQGMGALDLGMAFDGVPRVFRDQLAVDTFTNTGAARTFSGTIADSSKPFRVTLAWTDAPGNTTGNAYNNDLDLTVTVGGNTYKGNVFNGAFSATGGSADPRNNLESVFLPAGLAGSFVITITAANITSDGITNQPPNTDQDFALVIYNADQSPVPVFAINHVTLASEDCSSGNGAIDPGETVTLGVTLNNIGSANTTNLVVTLLATNGVTAPSAPQMYGTLVAGGSAVSKLFSFTAVGSCGGSASAVFQLQDGQVNFGVLSYNFALGLVTLTTQSSTNSTAISIPISGTSGKSGPYPSYIAISGLTSVVDKVTVTLRGLNHTYPDDIDAELIGPAGQAVMLMSDCGGGGDVSGLTLTFDDDAASVLPDSSTLTSGTYKPTNYGTGDTFTSPGTNSYDSNLSVFKNQNPNGNWRLFIMDDAAGDTGNLSQGWSLTLISSNADCCLGSADVGIGKSASSPALNVGSNVTFIINVTNFGPSAATAVVVTDAIPAGFNFASASVSQGGWNNNGNTVSANIGTLTNSAKASLAIQVTAAVGGSWTNRAGVSSATDDPNSANDGAAASVFVNQFPTVTGITNVVTDEDVSAGPIGFIIGDVETPVGSLTVSGISSDPNLVPQNEIIFGGSGANRTVTLNPAANQNGICTITISVSDGMATTNISFTLTVNSVNDAPVLAPISNRAVHAGTLVTITNQATDPDVPPQTLTFSLEVKPTGATINSSSGIFSWQTSDVNADTTNPVTVRVTDNGSPALSDTQSFSIAVRPRPFETILVSSNLFVIEWSSILGEDYRVLFKTNLTDTNWSLLPPDVTATGPVANTTDTNSAPSRFYRILVLP